MTSSRSAAAQTNLENTASEQSTIESLQTPKGTEASVFIMECSSYRGTRSVIQSTLSKRTLLYGGRQYLAGLGRIQLVCQ